MPRRKAADPTPTEQQVDCAASECSASFTPKQKSQRYCSATCRQRGARERKHADAAAAVDDKARTQTGGAAHKLVTVTEAELTKAGALDTVDGQLALQLARKLADPDVAGFDRLMEKLRGVLADVRGTSVAGGEGPAAEPAEPDDEVTKARRARAEAREAAGRS